MSLPRDDERPTNVRWLIVAMLMGFTVLGHFNRVSISVAGSTRFIGPQGLTAEQMGLVYSAFLLVYTLVMLPGGWVIDYLGPRRALTGMGLGMGFCVVLTGALGWCGLSIVSLWLPLIAIRGLAGALSSPLHPGAARSVSLWVPLANRSTANGLVTSGALIGMSVAYPGFGWLMDQLDWPLAFAVSGATMMLFALVWDRAATDDAVEHPWANEAEKNLVHSDGRLPPRTRASVGDFLSLFRNRGLVLLTLSYAAVSYFQYMFFYWIEYYFEKELRLPIADSRRAAFTINMAMAVGMICGGCCVDYVCRRWGRRWGCRGMALIAMGLGTAFGWVGVNSEDPQQIILFYSLSMGSFGLCESIFWTTAPTLERRSGGLACAFLNTVGNAVGLLAPIFTPWIGRHYGWTTAIAVACVVCGLGAILWLWIDSDAARHTPTDN